MNFHGLVCPKTDSPGQSAQYSRAPAAMLQSKQPSETAEAQHTKAACMWKHSLRARQESCRCKEVMRCWGAILLTNLNVVGPHIVTTFFPEPFTMHACMHDIDECAWSEVQTMPCWYVLHPKTIPQSEIAERSSQNDCSIASATPVRIHEDTNAHACIMSKVRAMAIIALNL